MGGTPAISVKLYRTQIFAVAVRVATARWLFEVIDGSNDSRLFYQMFDLLAAPGAENAGVTLVRRRLTVGLYVICHLSLIHI